MTNKHGRTWGHVHEDCRDAIFNYLVHGYEPGGFLTAVITNDLRRAACVADFENIERLGHVARFVAHALPEICTGSWNAMSYWMQLSEREREEILIEVRLLPTLFDVIKDPY
jgi:hypothetical protein